MYVLRRVLFTSLQHVFLPLEVIFRFYLSSYYPLIYPCFLLPISSTSNLYTYCTKSLARWLALRTIRSPLFLKNKSSSFFVYVILLSYHTQTITHKRTAMLMLSCFFILNNYISDFFIRPPPFRCLFLLFYYKHHLF